jgi:26S proteasome regulatory subunit N8
MTMDIENLLTKTTSAHIMIPKTVMIHPLVLLSVVDHYYRIAKDTKKRVVGVLLGSWKANNTILDISNSFALPFEEDEKEPAIWFLDHNYLENMWAMFRKVNARERIIGWYHTGPKLHSSDLDINEVIKRFTPHPALVIIDVHYREIGLPTNAYMAVEETQLQGKASKWTFQHLPTEMTAEEAEDIGVEHLLRDVRGDMAGSLSSRLLSLINSLQGMCHRLDRICRYLDEVSQGNYPINQDIIYNMQDVLFHASGLDGLDESRLKALATKGGDSLFVLYVASLIRSIIAVHNLITNKISNRELELKHEEEELALERQKLEHEKEVAEIKKLAQSQQQLHPKEDPKTKPSDSNDNNNSNNNT